MSDLFAALSQEDQEKISKYIKFYANHTDDSLNSNPAELSHILRVWAQNKETLFKVFKGNLILSKTITTKVTQDMLDDMIDQKIFEFNSKPLNFISKISNYFQQHYGYCSHEYEIISLLIKSSRIASNSANMTETLTIDNDHEIKILPNSKISRILGKIAKIVGIDGYEDFRIAQSQVLNFKELTGELCLSIHPLDYMTMSDNGCGWSSCMSWNDYGCYRQGTVEMMNSPYVIVAYLKSSSDFNLFQSTPMTWNSKKWRTLIIANSTIIANIKNYPYYHDELTHYALDWVRELMSDYLQNKDWFSPDIKTFDNNSIIHTTSTRITLATNYMYNDCDSINHECYLASDYTDGTLYFNYSGPSECMWCGATDIELDEEKRLLCDACWDSNSNSYCDECGERWDANDLTYVDGCFLCPYCYNDLTTYDPIDGVNHFNYNMFSIKVSFDQGKTAYETNMLIHPDAIKYKTYWTNYFKKLYNYRGTFYLYIEDYIKTPEHEDSFFGFETQEEFKAHCSRETVNLNEGKKYISMYNNEGWARF